MDTKVCPRCQVEKEINYSNFYYDKFSKSGFMGTCKLCKNQSSKGIRVNKIIVDLENKTKICSKCKKTKHFSEYNKGRDTKAGTMSECRQCYKDRRALAPSRSPEEIHDSFLKATYGKDFDYTELLKQQNGKCKICEVDSPGWKYKYFQVDHNHACCSGKKTCGKCVRGLLCHKCNTGLGQFQDSIELMEKAIQYLKESNGNSIPKVLQN